MARDQTSNRGQFTRTVRAGLDLAIPDHFIIRRHSDDESMPVQASRVDTYNPDQSADCGKILLAGRAKNGFIQVHPPQQES
jgi:hypothetical protein